MTTEKTLDFVLTKDGKLVAWMSGGLQMLDPQEVTKELTRWAKDVQRGCAIQRLPFEEAEVLTLWSQEDSAEKQEGML